MPLFASISLTSLIVLDPTNQPGYMSLYTQRGAPSAIAETKDGEFRAYAGGRTRLVTKKRRNKAFSITFEAVTIAQVNALDLLLGKTVLFRDTSGKKVWGAWLSTVVTPYSLTYPQLHVYQVAFQQVTFDEGTLA